MLFNEEELERIAESKDELEEGLLKQQLERFGMEEPASKTYSPLDKDSIESKFGNILGGLLGLKKGNSYGVS